MVTTAENNYDYLKHNCLRISGISLTYYDDKEVAEFSIDMLTIWPFKLDNQVLPKRKLGHTFDVYNKLITNK